MTLARAWNEVHAAKPPGWWVGTLLRLLLLTMLMGLLTACASTVPPATASLLAPTSPEASLEAPWAPDVRSVDPLTAQLLQRFGLRPSGPTTISAFRIGPPTEEGWVVVHEASRKIGLDFARLEGTNVHRRETPVVGNTVAGAYLGQCAI